MNHQDEYVFELMKLAFKIKEQETTKKESTFNTEDVISEFKKLFDAAEMQTSKRDKKTTARL